MKKKLSKWKGLNGLSTAHGRTIVANFLIFSQLRYRAQLMVIPDKIMKWIDKDAQALLWNKEIQFEEGERGTEKVNKRFMRQGSEYNYPPSYAHKILEPSYFAVGALGGSRLV